MLSELWFSDENHQRFHDACAGLGLTPPQLKALQSLRPGEAKGMRTLAEQWRCDASWVTGIVDGLEERGFVRRRVLATDRRVKTVLLTALGEKARRQALEVLHEPPTAMAKLDVTEQRALRKLLRKMAQAPTA